MPAEWTITGAFLCGTVVMNICHRSMHGKATSSVYGVFAHAGLGGFRWTSGLENAMHCESLPGDHRALWRVCGANVPGISAGTKPTRHGIEPGLRAF